MNAYTYDEITVGQEEHFSAVITEADMDAFRRMTGDENPLHNNEQYAKGRGFPGRVVYGMLTSSYLSTLAGVYLPGERSLIHEVEVKLTKPCFTGDTLTVSGTCTEKNDSFKRIVIKVRMTNGAGETVLRGTMKVGVAE